MLSVVDAALSPLTADWLLPAVGSLLLVDPEDCVGSLEASVLEVVSLVADADGSELALVEDESVLSCEGVTDEDSDGRSEPPERSSLTWEMVVPSPPEMAWPLTNSKAVIPAMASTKTATALIRILFQGSRRVSGSRSSTNAWESAAPRGGCGSVAAGSEAVCQRSKTTVSSVTVVSSVVSSSPRLTMTEVILSLVRFSEAV